MRKKSIRIAGHDIDDGLSFLNLLVLVLSFYVLGILIIDAVITLPPEVHRLIIITDYIACSIFFMDFCVRFYRAENKLHYMKWGWIDLLASIPVNGLLRFGRLARIIQLIRIIKAYRSIQHIAENIFKNHIKGTFSFAIILALMLVLMSSIAILEVETSPLNAPLSNACPLLTPFFGTCAPSNTWQHCCQKQATSTKSDP